MKSVVQVVSGDTDVDKWLHGPSFRLCIYVRIIFAYVSCLVQRRTLLKLVVIRSDLDLSKAQYLNKWKKHLLHAIKFSLETSIIYNMHPLVMIFATKGHIQQSTIQI